MKKRPRKKLGSAVFYPNRLYNNVLGNFANLKHLLANGATVIGRAALYAKRFTAMRTVDVVVCFYNFLYVYFFFNFLFYLGFFYLFLFYNNGRSSLLFFCV